ncbi:hypothetical protein FACS1894182_02460 [Bacteroidia bacterium]|nr:hypothetical protein FACS1894182_02460 [Bacteroidia bacterium]
MLDSILNTAKDYIQKEVVNNAAIPNHQNAAVSDVIFNTLSSSLKSHLGSSGSGSGFDLSQLGSLLGGGNNSGFLKNMQGTVVDALVKKIGLNPQVAQSIVSAILPGVISAVTKNMGGSAGGGVLGNLAGGLLGSLFGGK